MVDRGEHLLRGGSDPPGQLVERRPVGRAGVVLRKAQPEFIGLESRQEVQVQMEHLLAGGGAVGRPDVVTVGTQRPDEAWPQRRADLHEMPGDRRIARGEIGPVLTWYDQGVPLVHRKQIEKRDRSFVLIHHTCRRSPRHDVTEDAACHSRFPTRPEDRRTGAER